MGKDSAFLLQLLCVSICDRFFCGKCAGRRNYRKSRSNLPKYLDFLKAGSSASPIDVLKRAGVNMTEKEPIELALKVFEKRLTEMETLLDQMGK